jgi:predicted AlkP superfamily pyrophosphatase or phosphodiesterase
VRRRRELIVAVACAFALTASLLASPAAAGDKPKRGQRDIPSRVLIIVLDQARPDTIERYDMDNVKELMEKGASFPNAYVGHMAAETVISHNVITSGQLPKNMGWSNEVYRDSANLLGAGPYHVTSSMTCAQFAALIDAGGYSKIQDYLDDEFGETSAFASISQKRTSACTSGHTSSEVDDGTATPDPDDIIFQIRGGNVAAQCGSGWRRPEYVGVPRDYFGFTDDCSDRWWTFQGAGAYGTGGLSPANIYPLDGNRFVPGFDPAHIGGDNWSADATIRFIQNEPNWRGVLVSLGGIDKLGHMWGPEDEGEAGAAPGSMEEMRRLPFVAKNADEQVGRIVDALEAKGLLDDTLIVITADHAAQTGRPFHGVLAPGVENPLCAPPSTGIRSDCNWYFGSDSDEVYRDPSPAVAQLRDALAGNLDFSYQDGHVAAWLKDNSRAKKRQAAEAVLEMPGVIASYHTNAAQNDYRLFGTNRTRGAERSWFVRHGEELVDTMADTSGSDVVGLVATDVTYGVIGDHGGHSRLIQSIPMVFYGPGVGSKDSKKEIRLVDVLPTVLETMRIDYDDDALDGEAVKLRGR